MEITGRLTADAIIKTLTDGRQLVSFDLAVNDYYKTRAGELKQVATFYDCSYWITTKVAQHLTKGSIISVYGRTGYYAYKDKEGMAKGGLTFHVHNIRFVAQVAKAVATNQAAAPKPPTNTATSNTTATPIPETIDDLPF